MTAVTPKDRTIMPTLARVSPSLDATVPLRRVAVCIPTYRREIGLRGALESLARQDYPGPITIVVADNDIERRGGSETAAAFAAQSPHAIVTVIAAERGHSQASNAAFAAAVALSPPAELVAMMDDDQVATPTWLSKLVHAQTEFDADIVNGPAIAAFERAPESWMQKGFFGVQMATRGPIRRVLSSGNLLVRAEIIRDFLPEVFPNALGLSGGGDTDFAFRAEHAGLRVVAAADAVVHECIFMSRMSKEWLLQRAYRTGMTNVYAQARHDPSFAGCCVRVAKTAALFAVATSAMALTWFDEVQFLRARLMLARAQGKFDGHRGRLFLEYKATHGR